MPDASGKGESHFIRDLGSAGGTYIRILFGTRKELHPEMIILLSKHQFIVSSIDDSGQSSSTDHTIVPSSSSNRHNSEAIVSLAEQIINDISRERSSQFSQQKDELSARLKSRTMELLQYTQHGSSKAVEDCEDELLGAKAAFRSGTPFNHTLAAGLDSGDEHLAESKYSYSTPDRPNKSGFSAKEREKDSEDRDEVVDQRRGTRHFLHRRCTLTC